MTSGSGSPISIPAGCTRRPRTAVISGPRPRSPAALGARLAAGRPPADRLHAGRPPAAPRGRRHPRLSRGPVGLHRRASQRHGGRRPGPGLRRRVRLRPHGRRPTSRPALLRVDPDGTVTKAAEDMWFPNGSVITEDGTLMVDETFGNRVTAFDIAADGTLANRRTWAKFGELPSDRELGKMLAPGRRRPRRLLPGRGRGAMDSRRPRRPGYPGAPGGEIAEEIQPGTGVFACMLGGSRRPHVVHLRRARLPGGSAQERSRGQPDDRPRRHTPGGSALTCSRSRPLSRDRTRCPRCPASRGTTRCRHRQTVVARVPRRARPVVRIRPQVRPGALPPRARCRPARQDAADS